MCRAGIEISFNIASVFKILNFSGSIKNPTSRWRNQSMRSRLSRVVPFFVLVLIWALPAFAEQGMAIDPATCLGCHSDKISIQAFASSVHGKNACTSCHVDITDLIKHMKKEIKVQKVQCERCHKKENAEHYESVHVK